jgi:hypothetical protein
MTLFNTNNSWTPRMYLRPRVVAGQIVREPRRQPFSYIIPVAKRPRFLLVLVISLVFFATNPANAPILRNAIASCEDLFFKNSKSKRFFSTGTRRPTSRANIYFQPLVTNYGFVSLEEKLDTLVVSGLLHSWVCPYNHAHLGPLCDFIGTTRSSFCAEHVSTQSRVVFFLFELKLFFFCSNKFVSSKAHVVG